MKSRLFRIFLTIMAIAIGAFITIAIVFTGDSAKGPVEDFMDQVGKTAMSIDRYFTQQEESTQRAQQLGWFEKFRDSIELLRQPDTFLLGVYNNNITRSLQPVVSFEDRLNINVPLIHIYVAWGDKPEQQFPFRKCLAIYDLGSLPVITWEPWLTDFDKEKHPHLRDKNERDRGGLADIASGEYDFYLKSWTEELKDFGENVFIRFAHEMNDPYRYPWGPQNNDITDFVNAWKYVHRFFEKEGVNNVIWVWSPHIAYKPYSTYYPGDEFVDWVGVGVLNYGTVAPWSNWWSFHQIFGNNYIDLIQFHEPLMIAEFGSLAVGGNRAHWFESAFKNMDQHYPKVKSIVFFNSDADNTTTSKSLDWSLEGDTATVKAVKKGIYELGRTEYEE